MPWVGYRPDREKPGRFANQAVVAVVVEGMRCWHSSAIRGRWSKPITSAPPGGRGGVAPRRRVLARTPHLIWFVRRHLPEVQDTLGGHSERCKDCRWQDRRTHRRTVVLRVGPHGIGHHASVANHDACRSWLSLIALWRPVSGAARSCWRLAMMAQCGGRPPNTDGSTVHHAACNTCRDDGC